MLYIIPNYGLKIMEQLSFSSSKKTTKDTIDSYFECITECSIVDGHQECVSQCIEVHLKGENKNE